MISAVQIANYFIDKGVTEHRPVDQMKLQKLVYYSYGWYSSLHEAKAPLFFEDIQAWKFGPVISTLYHHTKTWGLSPISKPIEGHPKISDTELLNFLATIWASYSRFSGAQLSSFTHSLDSPWTAIYERYGKKIPSSGIKMDLPVIKKYFDELKVKAQQKIIEQQRDAAALQ